MKYTWTEKDIIPGRFVCKDINKDNKSFAPDDWTAKWTHKIGWRTEISKKDGHLCVIAMTDGAVYLSGNETVIADYLNREEMIPMPHKWLISTMDYLRDCYEGV
jgi:hypothetical protein